MLVKILYAQKLHKKYTIKNLNIKATLLGKKFGVIINTLKQKRIFNLKASSLNLFIYYI